MESRYDASAMLFDFTDAFAKAPRGTYVTYAEDVWSLEKKQAGGNSKSELARGIQACARAAWRLHLEGKAALFQRKRFNNHPRGNTFDYLAFKL